jgi:hypothetical protein
MEGIGLAQKLWHHDVTSYLDLQKLGSIVTKVINVFSLAILP